MPTEKLFDRDEYKENMNWLIGVLKSKGHVDTQDAFDYLMLSQLTRIADSRSIDRVYRVYATPDIPD